MRGHNREPVTRLRHPVIDAMRKFWCYADYFDAASERRALQYYCGRCSFVGDCVARVMATLESSGEADETLVGFTRDHGDLLASRGIWGKSFLYEDSVGNPLLLLGPGIDPGVNPTPVSPVDIGATVAAAVGAPTAEPCATLASPVNSAACG